MTDRPDWHVGLSEKDWLLDGRSINGPAVFENWKDLDWSKAWVDLGPSPAGNLGPYWHVPLKSGDTTHRLYPKLLKTKWLHVARQAVEESVRKDQNLVAAIVATAGGLVEGLPTGEHNILQRLRALREIEAASLKTAE